MKREFLMLAHHYKPYRDSLAGCYMSEKLDGMRCFWDGGVTRGMPKQYVSFANTEKDERYTVPQISTGLWSRLGNVIHAPADWLDKLPSVPMDGELYIYWQKRQYLMSTVKQLEPDDRWEKVNFIVFDLPSLDWFDCPINSKLIYEPKKDTPFRSKIKLMEKYCPDHMHKQTLLPMGKEQSHASAMEALDSVTSLGGEGLMIRKPDSIWYPRRDYGILKIKKMNDSEGVVLGYKSGAQTDKGSKLLGKMGSLKIKWRNTIFWLSGFTEDERTLGVVKGQQIPEKAQYAADFHKTNAAEGWARENPEQECPPFIEATHFPIGSLVTFKYRELTKDGMPEEARYWRKHVAF